MSDYLKKFKQLTSKWGIYQHGLLSIPNPEFGYAIDDQARALIVAHQFNQYKLEKIFLNFILNSKIDDTYYHYFYDNKNSISPDITHQASEDALGMVVWALIETGNTTGDSKKVIQNILTKAKSWIFLRSIAYILLGLTESKKTILEDDLVKKIIDSYKEDNGWNWFEDKLTYGNALIPWALWKRARTRQDNKSLEVAKKATEFLLKIYQKDGTPMPVSHLGLRKDDNNRLYFDQQAIEAAYLILCLTEAFMATDNINYKNMAQKWWGWFWGDNINKISLIDKNYGCFDGLIDTVDKVNLNQGAESTICFLMAYQAVKKLKLVD